MKVSKRTIHTGVLAAVLVAAGLLGPGTTASAAGPGESARIVAAIQAEPEQFTGIGFGRTEFEATRFAQARAYSAAAGAGYTAQECAKTSLVLFPPSAGDPRWQARVTLYCQH